MFKTQFAGPVTSVSFTLFESMGSYHISTRPTEFLGFFKQLQYLKLQIRLPYVLYTITIPTNSYLYT
jgi:hypothetical protein